jgi:hypothetical protein
MKTGGKDKAARRKAYEAAKRELAQAQKEAAREAQAMRAQKVTDPEKVLVHERPLRHHTEIPVRSTAHVEWKPHEATASMKGLKTLETQIFEKKAAAIRKKYGFD